MDAFLRERLSAELQADQVQEMRRGSPTALPLELTAEEKAQQHLADLRRQIEERQQILDAAATALAGMRGRLKAVNAAGLKLPRRAKAQLVIVNADLLVLEQRLKRGSIGPAAKKRKLKKRGA